MAGQKTSSEKSQKSIIREEDYVLLDEILEMLGRPSNLCIESDPNYTNDGVDYIANSDGAIAWRIDDKIYVSPIQKSINIELSDPRALERAAAFIGCAHNEEIYKVQCNLNPKVSNINENNIDKRIPELSGDHNKIFNEVLSLVSDDKKLKVRQLMAKLYRKGALDQIWGDAEMEKNNA